MLVVALRRGERIAQPLEQRGLGRAPRTIWRPTPITRADVVMTLATLLVLAAGLVASHLLGFLRGPDQMFGD